ncbi:MAG: hypothetical protein OEQ29_04735, partial [Alphaproteobacteria bacterium]|nr:hypothetical protein [Alphaproteobacteria bacterium]
MSSKAKAGKKKREPAVKQPAAPNILDDLIAKAPATMNKAARIKPIDFDTLSLDRLEAMAAAAEEVINCHR